MSTAEKHQIKKGDKFFESDHTEWTFIRETSEGLMFRAQDGFELTFSEADLSMLSRSKGGERAIV